MKADPETIERVMRAVQMAEDAGRAAAKEFSDRAERDASGRHIADAAGYAEVRTYDSGTAITKALLKLGIIRPKGHAGYYSLNLRFDIRDQSITLHEAAARAAAEVLEKELGQEFFMRGFMD